ncbi:MAG: (4Fe-4S)-binding protein [Acidobacteria bacterium]|nr:(4Fe-4S)-binding protein [Acidobacteriota bacterium]MBI3261712.1 (4Fe-4S)-binding protein [Acidobacteriota bacterium]
MIKRVEVNYRGIFQKLLGKYIGSDIVQIATRMGKVAFSNGRYSDAPERNGIPCKYFAFVSPDLTEEELEAECGAKLDIDEADVSIVVDDTMVKGVEPWGWHGVRPINEKVREKGCLLVVSQHPHDHLLKFIGKKPYSYRLATVAGTASLAGLWVYKDDLTRERVLGAIAAVDPGIMSIEAVESYLLDKMKEPHRAKAAREAYDATLRRTKIVAPTDGIEWLHEVPVLPKWHEFEDTGVVVRGVPRAFELGPRGQARNDAFKRGTTKTHRPVVRFDLCIKCTLCWLDCPDECFDPTDDGLFDVDYEVCVGCHKCASVCPIPECIVMVDELQFTDDKSPWEAHKRDPQAYIEWAELKKGKTRIAYQHVTGQGVNITEGKTVPPKVVTA